MTYFAFTTLTTVGLGDFHPKRNIERILCSFTMLFGVMVTSMVMDNFSKMVQQLRTFNKSFDDSERLSLFMGTIRKMNDGVPHKFEREIDEYFQFRWKFDKNQAISSEEDFDLLDQLPGRVQT